MSTKVLLRWLFISSLVVIILLLWVGTTPVRADCGGTQPSSCTICHAQLDPVSGKGEWHSIHASKDICIKCHWGNGSTMDKNLAHKDLVANPLNDIYTDCHSCHPQDYVGRAELFASTLGVKPESCSTPTPVVLSSASGRPPFGSDSISSQPTGKIPASSYFVLIFGGLASLFFFSLGLAWLNNHRVDGRI
jgi:hypothetical protein